MISRRTETNTKQIIKLTPTFGHDLMKKTLYSYMNVLKSLFQLKTLRPYPPNAAFYFLRGDCFFTRKMEVCKPPVSLRNTPFEDEKRNYFLRKLKLALVSHFQL